MSLRKGDRVRHPNSPAWGIGQVLDTVDAQTVRVFFVGAGERTIALDRVALVPVTGAEAANPLLDNLPSTEPGQLTRYRSLPDSIAHFVQKYPGGFHGRTFLQQEREYKVAAHALCRELLSEDEVTRLLSQGSPDEVIHRALRVVNATNLIFPNEKMALRDGLVADDNRARFAHALFQLLHGAGPLEPRFLSFCAVLEAIEAAKWPIASYFPFLYEPATHVFLKPGVTQHAAEVCAFEINYRPELNWRTYERVHAFARYLMTETAALEPRDMIDIQSFMWCIAPR